MEIQLIITTILLTTLVSAQSDTNTYEYNCLRLDDCKNSGVCDSGNCTCTGDYGNYDCGVLTTNTVCSSLTCNNGGTCYTDNGVDTCFCTYGYRGDTCDETDFQVECSGNKAEYKIYLPVEFSGLVQLRNGAAQADESCVIQEDVQADYKLYSIAVDISDAESDATTPCKKSQLNVGAEGSETFYEATLLVRFDPDITSPLDVIYRGNCTHKLETEIGKDLTNLDLNNNNLSSIEETKVHTPIDMVLLDKNGSVLDSAAVLYVGSNIKFVSYITDSEAFKTVRFESCVANNTLEEANNKKFILFERGCPTSKSKKFTTEQTHETYTTDDGEQPASSFLLEAFKFTDTNALGIVCTATICKDGDSKCDVPADCGAVRSESVTTTTAAPITTVVSNERRKRRAADDNSLDSPNNQTLSTIITISGPNDVNDLSRRTSGIDELSATVENCFNRSEIFAVVTVLASIVCILLIACLILGCLIIKRKAKSTEFESMPVPPSDRYRIPRAHVNDAFTLREV